MTIRETTSTKFSVIRFLYTLLLIVLVPFGLTLLVIRKLRSDAPAKARSLNRLGLGFEKQERGGVLIHCVSVGEVVAAAPIVRQLSTKTPSVPMFVTSTTETGARQAELLLGDCAKVYYLPFDIPLFINLMLRALNPGKVLITEVELWPNFIHACARRQAEIFVINARMTDKSVKSYRKISLLFTPMLTKLSGVCAQGQRDFDNYAALGMPKEKLHLTNNIKFDRVVSTTPSAEKVNDTAGLSNRRVLVGGSTHEGEENLLLSAYQQLKKQFPTLVLVLVPRHPQRFDKVYQLCGQTGRSTQRFSEQERCQENTEVFLIDAMGLLERFYEVADVAFVGGSINPRGGHNALEPAAYGKPIMMGSSRHNNPVICESLAASGALVTTDSLDQLISVTQRWLADTKEAQQAGDNGRKVIVNNQGAVEATLEVITG